MTGRAEQDLRFQEQINRRLERLPEIFTAYYRYLEADDKSYGTCLLYISHVEDFMKYVIGGDGANDNEFYKKVTVAMARDYIISLRHSEDGSQAGDSIQATKWSACNSFYEFLLVDDYTNENPFTKTKRPKNKVQKPIVFLEEEEINAIIDKIRRTANRTMVNRDIALVTLGITSGLRCSALLNINVTDINWKNNEIKVIEKGAKTRTIHFGDHTRAALAKWIVDRNTYFDDLDTDALFISQFRKRITAQGVSNLIKKYTAGLDKHVTMHTLRKTTATQAAKAGADINTVAAMLNHNSIETTRKYMAVLDENKEKASRALDNIFMQQNY